MPAFSFEFLFNFAVAFAACQYVLKPVLDKFVLPVVSKAVSAAAPKEG